MKETMKYLLILILVTVSFAESAFCKDIANVIDEALSVAESRAKVRNQVSIKDLNKEAPVFGTYYIEGYVSKIYTCPPCPSGAQCALCMRDNVVVSTKKKFLRKYNLTNSDIIVFVEDIEQFEIGKKYRMLIKVLDVKTTLQPINNLQLIYHEQIRG